MPMLKNTKPAPVIRTGPKPSFDWDRALSWSQISSFEYDKEQWYRKYVLKQKQPTTPAMEFGKTTGERIEKDKKYLPQIPRQIVMEYEFEAVYEFKFRIHQKKRVKLTGFADSFGDAIFRLEEYKTGKISKPWTQKRADQHGQITMYLFMKWLKERIPPERFTCGLHWMPTEELPDGTVQFVEPIEDYIKHFETKRTMKDLREFAQRIERSIEAMVSYCESHP